MTLIASEGNMIRWAFCGRLADVDGNAIFNTFVPIDDEDDTTLAPRGRMGNPEPLLLIVTICLSGCCKMNNFEKNIFI